LFISYLFPIVSVEKQLLNSGEPIPRQLSCGVSEQNTKKVLDGIGFLVSLLQGVSIRLIHFVANDRFS